MFVPPSVIAGWFFFNMEKPILISPLALTLHGVESKMLETVMRLEPPPPFRMTADVVQGNLIVVAIPEYDIQKALESEDEEIDEDFLLATAPMGVYAFAEVDFEDFCESGSEFISGSYNGMRLYISATRI